MGRLASDGVDPLPVHNSGEFPRVNRAFLVLFEMDMERRSFSMRRKRAPKFQPDFVAPVKPTQFEALASVFVLEHQRGCRRLTQEHATYP